VNKFFNWLFGNQQQKPAVETQEMVNTAPLSEQQIQSILHNSNTRYELQQLVASCGQSVGKQRELNEDSLFALTATMAGNSGNLPFGLYIVADGMGGHQFGEVASNTAIRSVAGYIVKKFHPYLFQINPEPMEESFQEIMQAAVREAQRAIQKEAPGSGTTLTAALVVGQQVTIAHVGDSRAYFIPRPLAGQAPGGVGTHHTRGSSQLSPSQRIVSCPGPGRDPGSGHLHPGVPTDRLPYDLQRWPVGCDHRAGSRSLHQ
jgi:hypothetical protein